MDSNLEILREVLLDPNSYVQSINGLSKYSRFQDYRLVYLGGRLYLTESGLAVPIEIHTSIPSNGTLLPAVHHGVVVQDNLFVAALWCHRIWKLKGPPLKNSNLFEREGKVYLEHWPIPRQLALVEGIEDKTKLIISMTLLATNASETTNPLPSFRAHGELDTFPLQDEFRFTKRDRGTACCTRLEREYYEDLILTKNDKGIVPPNVDIGISHVKSVLKLPGPVRYSYLTRLYAVSTVAPYQVIAKSGLFCLDWEDDDWKKEYLNLKIRDLVYDCPAVHFPSGMTVSATNQSNVIVAYGILDERPRMVEYSKRELALHLFAAHPKGNRAHATRES